MKKIIFYVGSLIASTLLMFCFFSKIFITDSLIFPFAIYPFDICRKYPYIWNLIKKVYIISFLISNLIIERIIYVRFIEPKNINQNKKSKINLKNSEPTLKILIGKDNEQRNIYIEENGLYQNILITGTIGSGKTSSALYPMTKQLIEYKANNFKEKFSMLILDVKGNYYKQVLKFAKNAGRIKDVIIIEIGGKYKYNPLDKQVTFSFIFPLLLLTSAYPK